MLRTFVLFIMTRLAALVPAIPGAGRIVAGLCAGLTCLASTADLKISIQTPPWDQSQPLWRRVTYTIIVRNAGPDTATQVVVTNQVVRMERESRSALASRRIAEHEHGYFLRCLPGRESQRATCAHVILTGHATAVPSRVVKGTSILPSAPLRRRTSSLATPASSQMMAPALRTATPTRLHCL